jgi:PhnB protein
MATADQNSSPVIEKINSSIAPWLSVPDSEKAIAFYKTALNANETYRLDTPDGPIVRLSVDRAEFWVSGSEESAKDIKQLGGGSIRMILTVSDPDTLFTNALNAGATEIFPVQEQHGWRTGRMIDPFGLHWEIGRPVE